jgi:TonB family protein
MRRICNGLFAALVVLFAGLGCGGSSTAPATTPVEHESEADARSGPHHASAPDVDEDDDEDVEIEGLKGHLDPYQIKDGLKPHQRALSACYHDVLAHARFIGGTIELSFVVGLDGAVKQVAMSKSDLGSWAVEKCLLALARTMKFAKPKGHGDAEFTLPLDFSSGSNRALWWSEQQSEQEAEEHMPELDTCSDAWAGGPHNVWVTLYIGNRGAVRSIGFASPGGTIDDGWADCVAEAASQWVLTDPRGKVAKGGFRYRLE